VARLQRVAAGLAAEVERLRVHHSRMILVGRSRYCGKARSG
jgi:hypothetical protein